MLTLLRQRIRFAAQVAFFAVPTLLSSFQAAQAGDILWGVNGHPINSPIFSDYEKQFEVLHQNHLTTYRVDIDLTKDAQDKAIRKMRILIPLAKKWGITLRPELEVPFTWGDRTDAGKYPAGNRAALYRQGFDRVYSFVRLFKDDIQDWELENELNLLVHDTQGSSLFGRGWTPGEFDTPLMTDWSFVLKGMSDAVDNVNKNYGTKLRRILGTTTTNFGFLSFMQAKGVNYEVLGYHYYVRKGESPYAAWSKATPSFDLFQKLASFGKPVHFTEVNAGEIYDKDYLNKDDDGFTQKGYQGLSDTLDYLKNQKEMNLEEVDIYELLDEPGKDGAEAKFGLMYGLNSPKSALSLLRQFSEPRS